MPYQENSVDISPCRRHSRILHEGDHQVEQNGPRKSRAVLPKLEQPDGEELATKTDVQEPQKADAWSRRPWQIGGQWRGWRRLRGFLHGLPVVLKRVAGGVHRQLIRQVEEIVRSGEAAALPLTFPAGVADPHLFHPDQDPDPGL